jgi:hypothetical protein
MIAHTHITHSGQSAPTVSLPGDSGRFGGGGGEVQASGNLPPPVAALASAPQIVLPVATTQRLWLHMVHVHRARHAAYLAPRVTRQNPYPDTLPLTPIASFSRRTLSLVISAGTRSTEATLHRQIRASCRTTWGGDFHRGTNLNVSGWNSPLMAACHSSRKPCGGSS